jgi:hypothetical protein
MKLEKKPCPCGYKGLDGKGKCSKFILPPLINSPDASLTSEGADEVIAAFEDAERFRWCVRKATVAASARYLPEDKRVAFIDSMRARHPIEE